MRFHRDLPLCAGFAGDRSRAVDPVRPVRVTRALIFAMLAACGTPSAPEPFDGTVHRFVIDRFDLPASNARSVQLGDDLNGDGAVDNQIGMVIATLAGQHDLAPNPSDLRNLLPTAIEINAHDLINDDHVGVSYIGRPGYETTPATGAFVESAFVSERSRATSHPAHGAMVLPIFADADPIEFPIQHAEIDLQPDGAGGYTGQLRGVVDPAAALVRAVASTYQMLRSNPQDHVAFADLLTGDLFDHTGPKAPVTLGSLASSTLLKSFVAPDLWLDNQQWLSFGFQFHLVACDAGTCAPATVIDHCDDRVEDDDEIDVDCGGSCHACGFDARCVVGSDCQTGGCDHGICREPTCNDGLQDGFETGVDCGAYGCAACGTSP
jgi:hypothetical protein